MNAVNSRSVRDLFPLTRASCVPFYQRWRAQFGVVRCGNALKLKHLPRPSRIQLRVRRLSNSRPVVSLRASFLQRQTTNTRSGLPTSRSAHSSRWQAFERARARAPTMQNCCHVSHRYDNVPESRCTIFRIARPPLTMELHPSRRPDASPRTASLRTAPDSLIDLRQVLTKLDKCPLENQPRPHVLDGDLRNERRKTSLITTRFLLAVIAPRKQRDPSLGENIRQESRLRWPGQT